MEEAKYVAHGAPPFRLSCRIGYSGCGGRADCLSAIRPAKAENSARTTQKSMATIALGVRARGPQAM